MARVVFPDHLLTVTGGVRYRIDQDRLNDPTQDTRQDSQAVYVGTAVKF